MLHNDPLRGSGRALIALMLVTEWRLTGALICCAEDEPWRVSAIADGPKCVDPAFIQAECF